MMSTAANKPPEDSTLENVLHVRERVASACFIPIPRGEKGPRLKDWPHKATRDPEMLQRWFGPGGLYENDNYGVCNVVALDIDVKNSAPGIESFRALDISKDVWGTAFRVKTPSGGYHVIFSLPEGAEVRSRDGWRPGIDIKAGLSGQVVGAGCISIKDGAEVGRYAVMNDVVAAPCPEVLLDLILADHGKPKKKAKRGEVAPGAELDDPAIIDRMIEYLQTKAPQCVEGERNGNAFRVAAHLKDHGVLEAETLSLMIEHWLVGEDNFGMERTVASAYEGNSDNAIGSKTPGARLEETRRDFAGVKIDAPPTEQLPQGPWKEYWAGDQAIGLDQQWLFYQRVPQVGTMLVVGPSNAGKSFLALRIAECLATGTAFFGIEPDEMVGTLIFAGEGMGGLVARMKSLPEGLPIVTVRAPAFNDAPNIAAANELINAKAAHMKERFGVRLGFIVIDTLTAVSLLEDENNNSECGRAMKSLGNWAEEVGCVVAAVHHPPKNGHGPRGGSAIKAAADVVIEVIHEEGAKVRKLTCSKNRDAPIGDWGAFMLPIETIEMDSRGRPVTTCKVEECETPQDSVFLDPATATDLDEAIGERRFHHDIRSPDAVTRLIAERMDLDHSMPFGRKQATGLRDAMVRSGAWVKVMETIKGRDVWFVQKASGGERLASQSAQS